jgi:hypothetical protein
MRLDDDLVHFLKDPFVVLRMFYQHVDKILACQITRLGTSKEESKAFIDNQLIVLPSSFIFE